jgi:hypothetical protein
MNHKSAFESTATTAALSADIAAQVANALPVRFSNPHSRTSAARHWAW